MRRFRAAPALFSLIVGAALFLFSLLTLSPVAGRSAEEQRLRVEQAVRRAAVQCYALEGAYPPDVDYLKEHYGVRYDERRFFVHYQPSGANLTPNIAVILSLDEPE